MVDTFTDVFLKPDDPLSVRDHGDDGLVVTIGRTGALKLFVADLPELVRLEAALRAEIQRVTAERLAAIRAPRCSGARYLVNPDAPEEGTDVHHDGPCPAHPVGVAA